jgi:hypothetical protein
VSFVQNAEAIAKRAMDSIDPKLSEKYSLAIKFLADNPAMAAALKGKNAPAVGSEAYIIASATSFKKGRDPRTPQPPSTIPDAMVGIILNKYFEIPSKDLVRAEEWHRLSMGAENIVGELLERYIADNVEKYGWIWCSGSMVKAVDFIYHDDADGWHSLQVKNRDNSENSSSSAIRNGTPIQKWHRTFSKKAGDNWVNFPAIKGKVEMSEAGFKAYVMAYLETLRSL